jgi:hypothetical protein
MQDLIFLKRGSVQTQYETYILDEFFQSRIHGKKDPGSASKNFKYF